MSRVISFLSENKDQLLEYKKINNEKFDAKIEKAELKVETLKNEKAKFNAEIDTEIAKYKN